MCVKRSFTSVLLPSAFGPYLSRQLSPWFVSFLNRPKLPPSVAPERDVATVSFEVLFVWHLQW